MEFRAPPEPAALPLIDSHATEVAADVETAWASLVLFLPTPAPVYVRAGAGALGCDVTDVSGWETPGVGATVVGFTVVAFDVPTTLALAGRHRFSNYALTYRLHPSGAGTRLMAESRGEFPGVAGAAYRTLVIGSRGHVVAVRGLLRRIKTLAERVDG